MREKQEIRRIEIGIIQLVVVVFAAMVASKIPYTEITQGSIVLLGVVHVVSYYISSYYENLKYRGYLGLTHCNCQILFHICSNCNISLVFCRWKFFNLTSRDFFTSP